MYTLPSDAIAGSIYFNQFLDTTKDIVVSFDYACYGTSVSGSEGFRVFFTNTYAPYVQNGGPGPGLGYSAASNVLANGITSWLGIPQGILGIGFDLTGNFGSTIYNTQTIGGYNDIQPNTIAVRADYSNNYPVLTRTQNLSSLSFSRSMGLYQQVLSGQSPVYQRVRVRVTDFGQRVVVDIKSPSDIYFTNYLNFTLSSTPQITWPSSVWCGLSFASGQTTDTTFKVKGLNINGNITQNTGTGSIYYTYALSPQLTATGSYFTHINSASAYSDTLAYNETLSAVNINIGTTTNPNLTSALITVAGTVPYTAGDNLIQGLQS